MCINLLNRASATVFRYFPRAAAGLFFLATTPVAFSQDSRDFLARVLTESQAQEFAVYLLGNVPGLPPIAQSLHIPVHQPNTVPTLTTSSANRWLPKVAAEGGFGRIQLALDFLIFLKLRDFFKL